ncbi:hypothetical protein V1478_004026 [Vespula squamosa]|uniref:Uncharacterized protein n=1 Tax=Vespula squamosa TaxID=30214 RepID=A0ABD2BPX3_VESSQ
MRANGTNNAESEGESGRGLRSGVVIAGTTSQRFIYGSYLLPPCKFFTKTQGEYRSSAMIAHASYYNEHIHLAENFNGRLSNKVYLKKKFDPSTSPTFRYCESKMKRRYHNGRSRRLWHKGVFWKMLHALSCPLNTKLAEPLIKTNQ